MFGQTRIHVTHPIPSPKSPITPTYTFHSLQIPSTIKPNINLHLRCPPIANSTA
jgi:hypothetical protein